MLYKGLPVGRLRDNFMTHKERLLMSLNHEEPDRVPISVRYTPEMEKKLLEYLGVKTEELSLHASDGGITPHLMDDDVLISVIGPCTGFYLSDEQEYYDEWGIKWRCVENAAGGRYTEIAEHPLANIKDPSKFIIPDFKSEQRYTGTKKLVEKHGKEFAIFGGIPCTLFEISWFLRGMDRVMQDMILNKDFLHAYLDKLLTWSIDAGTELVKIGVDIIWIGDDFGAQERMLISPAMFREFIKPRYDRLFSLLKQINPNIKFALHTDGYVYPIIKDLIDIGLDILNPIQPKSMDPAKIKKEFGKHLTFWGTIDNQEVMPFGTVDDVVNEVKLRLKTVAHRGGLIIAPAHNIQPQTSLDKVLAIYETVKKFGQYPINL